MNLSYKCGREYPLVPYTQNEETKEIAIKVALHQEESAHFKIVFTLYDPTEKVVLPFTKRENERVQGLWNETCFEFFITDQKASYCEGNFTLDFGWNLFWFDSYRQSPLVEFAVNENKNPIRDIYLSGKKSQLVIDIPENLMRKFDRDQIKFSLTTVIKTKSGNTHYFALKHADTKPNFHHPESFLHFE